MVTWEEIELVIWVQILNKGISILICVNAFGKDINPSLLSIPGMGKYGKVGSLALRQPVLEKENSAFKPAVLKFKKWQMWKVYLNFLLELFSQNIVTCIF